MSEIRKKWSGDFPRPEAPDLVLSALVKWVPDSTKRYSTINGYEPNNITAAVAWTKIPRDLVASDAFISREQAQTWIDLQISNGAVTSWYNQYAQPRLPQKPYTLREIPAKTIDKITYIEIIGEQNKFMVAGQNLLDLNPLGRPRNLDIHAEPIKRKNYPRKNTGIFHIRRNSKCLETPKGVYQSVSAAAGDMGITFSGITHHLNKGTQGYRYISVEEYLLRVNELNTNSTTE